MQTLSPSQLMGESRKFSAINVGPPKSGKTFATATLLKSNLNIFPIWYHDFDQGSAAFLTAALKLGIPLSDLDSKVKIFRYGVGSDRMGEQRTRKRYSEPSLEFIKQINKPYDYIDPQTRVYKPGAQEAGHVPGLMVIDSLTNFQEELLDFVLVLGQHELSQAGTDARTDYGLVMGKITEAINTIKGLPCSFILNCHEQILQDETTGKIQQQVMCYGKNTLSQTIQNHFDIVLYSFAQGGKYEWYTAPQAGIKSAGTRFKVLTETKIAQDYNLII